MSLSRFWRRAIRGRRTTDRLREQVERELAFHLEMLVQENLEAGMDAAAARAAARQRFGDYDETLAEGSRLRAGTARRRRRADFLDALLQDLSFGLRLFRRNPGFTLVVVFALALGVGANATVFNILNGSFFLPPQGVTDPDRLRALARVVPTRNLDAAAIGNTFTYQELVDYRDHNRVFSGLMAYSSAVMDIGVAGETRRVPGALVSSNFFAVLGAPIALGRAFSINEERERGAHPVAVISHGLWQSRFGADDDILGTEMTLNGRSFTVVGVAAEGFRGHEGWETHEVWVPLSTFREASPGGLASLGNRWTWLRLVGRIEPGISLALARAEMNALSRGLEELNPDEDRRAGVTLAMDPPGSKIDSAEAAGLVPTVFATVGILLFVVWANVSSLFLARMAGRRAEIGVRLALGAGRIRVIRQLLSESTLLALLGGALGFVLALWLDDLLLAWTISGEFARLDLSLDGRAIAFALLLSIVSGAAVAVGSARRVLRLDPGAAMKGQRGATIHASPVRSALAVSQLSMSLALLTCAGLLIGYLHGSREPASVVEPDEILLVSVQPSHQGYTTAQAKVFYRSLLERLGDIPGVRAVSLARSSTTDSSWMKERVTSEDRGEATDESWIETHYGTVSPNYFQTLGSELVAGREFAPDDRDGTSQVVIVNETLAHRLWPGESPLGRRVRIDGWGESGVFEVVGLARDRPTRSGARPFLYFNLFHNHPWPASSCTLVMRTTGNPMSLLPAVQREVQALDPNLPLFDPRTFRTEQRDDSFAAGYRFFSAMTGVPGVLVLVLAAVALYGVISYGVSERTHEIGIRMALGAKRGDVLRQVLRQGLLFALLGTAIGFLTSIALLRFLLFLLDETSEELPMNPGVFVSVSLLLIGVALVASYLPARRASEVDPMVALRAE